jgi:hypothetical protein
MKFLLATVVSCIGMAGLNARAQEPVVGVPNADTLFVNSDPKLNANEQAAYHIVKDFKDPHRRRDCAGRLRDRGLSPGNEGIEGSGE